MDEVLGGSDVVVQKQSQRLVPKKILPKAQIPRFVAEDQAKHRTQDVPESNYSLPLTDPSCLQAQPFATLAGLERLHRA